MYRRYPWRQADRIEVKSHLEKRAVTLALNLPPDLEDRLRYEAKRRGLTAEALILELLDQYLPSSRVPAQEAIALLQPSIDEEESQGQQKTGEDLSGALDEDRLSSRELFLPNTGSHPVDRVSGVISLGRPIDELLDDMRGPRPRKE
jgi:plasmid stability protein